MIINTSTLRRLGLSLLIPALYGMTSIPSVFAESVADGELVPPVIQADCCITNAPPIYVNNFKKDLKNNEVTFYDSAGKAYPPVKITQNTLITFGGTKTYYVIPNADPRNPLIVESCGDDSTPAPGCTGPVSLRYGGNVDFSKMNTVELAASPTS
jgi:hypothetical protein